MSLKTEDIYKKKYLKYKYKYRALQNKLKGGYGNPFGTIGTFLSGLFIGTPTPTTSKTSTIPTTPSTTTPSTTTSTTPTTSTDLPTKKQKDKANGKTSTPTTPKSQTPEEKKKEAHDEKRKRFEDSYKGSVVSCDKNKKKNHILCDGKKIEYQMPCNNLVENKYEVCLEEAKKNYDTNVNTI